MRPQPKWLRALGNTRDGVFISDATQRIVFWNKGAERLLGHTRSEVLGRQCHKVIAGRVRNKRWCRPDCQVRRCLQRGTELENFDLLTSTKGGQAVWVNVSIIGLPQKQQVLTLHLLRDINHQKRLERAVDHIARTLKVYGVLPDQTQEARSPGRKTEPPYSLSAGKPALTARELEIFGFLSHGFSTLAIADRLGLSQHTVRNHIKNALRKSGLRSRAEAVSFAIRNGLL